MESDTSTAHSRVPEPEELRPYRKRQLAHRWFSALLILLFGIAWLFTQQGEPVVLPSGQRIVLLSVGRYQIEDGDPLLLLRYQTGIDIADTTALRQQARQVWLLLRPEAERGHYLTAALVAQSPLTGLCFRGQGLCRFRQYGFVLRYSSDKGWYFTE